MKLKPIWAGLMLATACAVAMAQQSGATGPPQDKPVRTTGDQVAQFEAAIKPYIEQARRSYPEAKGRFLKGLPPKHTFYITTRVRDTNGRFERVFVRVKQISGISITGNIASDVTLVRGYKNGDAYTFPESELIDWTIADANGSEEGNFVGKFLETYQPEPAASGLRWHDRVVTPDSMNRRIVAAAFQNAGSAPIPRGALFDIGYPRSAEEYASMDGNAVLLITAITQGRDDLPLKRVYVMHEGRAIELKLIRQELTDLSGSTNLTVRVFGPFRSDALYLLPIYLRKTSGELLADFSGSGSTLRLATFGTPMSPEVSALPIAPPKGSGPVESALTAFLQREYPGVLSESPAK